MTLRLAAWICAGILPFSAAADWRDDLTPPQPGGFPPPTPFEARYRFGWGAVTAAEGSFDLSHPERGQLQLKVGAKTVGVVRGIWRMDVAHTARCDAASLRPIALQQTESYRDETLKTDLRFSPDAVTRRQERKPAEGVRPKEKRFKFPNIFDLHTALLFVRSQPLRTDEVYRIVVYPAKAAYLATARVTGTERIRVAGKEYPAIKLDLELQKISKKLELEPHKKFKQATAWISDDRDRLLLKVKTEVFVGSVWAELESVKSRDPAARRTAAR